MSAATDTGQAQTITVYTNQTQAAFMGVTLDADDVQTGSQGALIVKSGDEQVAWFPAGSWIAAVRDSARTDPEQ